MMNRLPMVLLLLLDTSGTDGTFSGRLVYRGSFSTSPTLVGTEKNRRTRASS
jgi:hypothetical protein